MAATIAATVGAGVATTINADCSDARARVAMRSADTSNPLSAAAATVASERLYPNAGRPVAASARSNEPPIKPRPRTQTEGRCCGVVAVTRSDWHIRLVRRSRGCCRELGLPAPTATVTAWQLHARKM